MQNRKSGKPFVGEVPVPALQKGKVLVRTVASLISAGTERSAVEAGNKSLVTKARERPDLVQTVITKVRTEGLLNTIGAVRSKLAGSQTLGYSAAGVVVEVGGDVTEFKVGDRVACAGVGFASHAEVLSVPKNLCVHLPETVDFEDGAFGTLGAIALQGVRLAAPTLGESVVVIGLGLVGQLTVQLLKANGCRVFGIDLDQSKVDLALEMGADAAAVSDDNTPKVINEWTRGHGADAVIITASSESNQPVELAGTISRMKGRVVVVGLTGLEIPRPLYFKRELSLTVSSSYGPGRYDPVYEERGHDYPFGYVRWTEKRNIEAFVELVAAGKVNVNRLISHRFAIEEAERAYQLISGELNEPYLGVILKYDPEAEVSRRIKLDTKPSQVRRDKSVVLGVVGAGGYVPAMLLPHFKTAGAAFQSIATASGVSANDVGKRFGFSYAVSSAEEVITDGDVNLVLIGTRHDLHAGLAQEALQKQKHVFVEKPLALNDRELDNVLEAAANSKGQLMVGFNRRYSPLAVRAKEFFANRNAPLSILYRINSGRIRKDHWIQDKEVGGGRIVGEVCHFVDLMQFLTGSLPVSVFAESIAGNVDQVNAHDSVFINLRFADGSNGCIAYLSEGDNSLAKERVEIFGDGKTFVIDDFRSGSFHQNGHAQPITQREQDKGQAEQVRTVCAVVTEGRPAPISLEELESTTRTTFRILESLQSGMKVWSAES
ncbi:MAG TPA: bi-domain-containing oxidoreductase [Pyrinomonadaceae bacterium]|nr:bi-domain-containing oxidoreductase [Pyrinomonadaceae bacterium]